MEERGGSLAGLVKPEQLAFRLRWAEVQLLNRARLTTDEVRILRGIARAIKLKRQ